ncbi:hypothetical protein BLOT_016281, partial [Blomia tropicalis]
CCSAGEIFILRISEMYYDPLGDKTNYVPVVDEGDLLNCRECLTLDDATRFTKRINHFKELGRKREEANLFAHSVHSFIRSFIQFNVLVYHF